MWVLWRGMRLTEGCGGRRRAVATPNRESQKKKKLAKRLTESHMIRRVQILTLQQSMRGTPSA